MQEKKVDSKPILLLGSGGLSYSIAVCLLHAGHDIHVCTPDAEAAKTAIALYLSEMSEEVPCSGQITFLQVLSSNIFYEGAMAITEEDADSKKRTVAMIENYLLPDAFIAINTESIGLDAVQAAAKHPERVIGLNWTEPAHTTRFLEIIKNSCTSSAVYQRVEALSMQWSKDAYTVENFGVRSRLLSALIREASYLVENGYASVEDIDRACRNDAGYYLPFAGNFRYMDLMGTYAYGMVMKDLNPDLSTETSLPGFFKAIVEEGALGIENGRGFYSYTQDEAAYWRNMFREYSYQIEKVIDKYPFNYKQNGTHS
ncbi:MAG: 3-hydroxyacyl-CoA dehydrogenase family protein [Chitinophagaceae bacterium]|nr:MAG: 3-hydroxyacyl-CoA dehydrogenase family protein [Chitinophagaceae bacterium]